MGEIPEIGKISAEIFKELIFPRLGAESDSVLVGPKHGTDVGIVEIGGKAVSMTTDPVFIVPEYGWERAAWFAINILASDAVTCASTAESAVAAQTGRSSDCSCSTDAAHTTLTAGTAVTDQQTAGTTGTTRATHSTRAA